MNKHCTMNKQNSSMWSCACTEATHTPISRPQRWSAWRWSALSPAASKPSFTCLMPPTGSTASLGIKGCKASRVGPHPLQGRERGSCQPSSLHKSHQCSPLLKTEAGPSGIPAVAHLPPSRLGSSSSCVRSHRAPSPCLADNLFAPALSALQGNKMLRLHISQGHGLVAHNFKKPTPLPLVPWRNSFALPMLCRIGWSWSKRETLKRKRVRALLNPTDLFCFVLVLKPANFQSEGWGIVLLELLERWPRSLFHVESGALNVQAQLRREDLEGAGEVGTVV